MLTHGYTLGSLLPDYARAGFGLALTAGPLLLVNPSSVMVYILGALALLFAGFGLRTGLRHATRIEVSDQGIRTLGPIARVIEWRDLERIKLRFFSTNRLRKEGWMQISVQGRGGRIAADSTISGFPDLARTAVLSAQEHGVSIDEYTLTNLTAMGIDIGEPQ